MLFLLALPIAAAGCGESGAPNAPELVRKCGELDGVEPVDPVVVEEDEVGCPVFAPVPCVRSLESYVSVCAPGCWPDTGVAEDGDEWLLGCRSTVPVACLDLESEPRPRACVLDPDDQSPYGYSSHDCAVAFLRLYCWQRCDGTGPLNPELCPL